jgi:hypothetical protein
MISAIKNIWRQIKTMMQPKPKPNPSAEEPQNELARDHVVHEEAEVIHQEAQAVHQEEGNEPQAAQLPAPVTVPVVVTAPPFSDVYAASAQAFADSRADTEARKLERKEARAAGAKVAEDRAAMNTRHRAEEAAMDARAIAVDNRITEANADVDSAIDDDMDTARALRNVLNTFLGE